MKPAFLFISREEFIQIIILLELAASIIWEQPLNYLE